VIESAAFRQRRKIGAGFGRSTRGGFRADVLSRRKSLEGTGILDGRATPRAEHADTLNEARERASFKARALGWPNYFELDTGENFSDATTDSIYVLEVKTEFVAQPL